MTSTLQRWTGVRAAVSSVFVCLSLVLLLVSGCQGRSTEKSAPVGGISGTVTYQGQPVTEGMVVFSNAELNTDYAGELDAQGKYSVTGAVVGKTLVSVRPLPVETPMDVDPKTVKAPDPANIPKKYRDPKTSGLDLEVTEGAMTFDIQMKS